MEMLELLIGVMDMEVDKVTDEVADMMVELEVDKVAEMVVHCCIPVSLLIGDDQYKEPMVNTEII